MLSRDGFQAQRAARAKAQHSKALWGRKQRDKAEKLAKQAADSLECCDQHLGLGPRTGAWLEPEVLGALVAGGGRRGCSGSGRGGGAPPQTIEAGATGLGRGGLQVREPANEDLRE